MSTSCFRTDWYLLSLNVLQSPEASGGQIKQAYYGMMKECHPDLTGEHPDSTAFCKFINEVYEVRPSCTPLRVSEMFVM
jgi:DnaJ-class molecular chaperone